MEKTDIKMKAQRNDELPVKCQDCSKLRKPDIHGKCDICFKLAFEERVLCDLNRCVQEEAGFECHAFQPTLKLVGSPGKQADDLDIDLPAAGEKDPLSELLDSDKIGYERALAVQKLDRDPDGVYIQLKYHFAWNVFRRISLLAPTKKFFGFVYDTFLSCSEMVDGFVQLLYLAPDHVHLFVESNEDLSPEDIATKIKQYSNNAILEKFPSVIDKLDVDTGIWDEAYFVETVS